MDRIEEMVAAALAGLQDDTDGLLRLRLALERRKRAKQRALLRIRQALESGRKDKTAPEMSGVRTVCWHPVDRLARQPASLPSDVVADTWVAENAGLGRAHP